MAIRHTVKELLANNIVTRTMKHIVIINNDRDFEYLEYRFSSMSYFRICSDELILETTNFSSLRNNDIFVLQLPQGIMLVS